MLAASLPADWETRRAAGALGELTRYGVETRYPDLGEPEPTAEEARRAVDQADSLQRAVRRDLEARGVHFLASLRQPQPGHNDESHDR